MKRQGLVAAAVFVAVLLGVVLVLQRGRSDNGAKAPVTAGERVFVDDSLGVRLRLPDSPGWSLRREPAGRLDGRILTAIHDGGEATVSVVVLPASPTTTLEDVFKGRQRQMAPAFNVDDLNKAIARIIRDETRDMGGRVYKQWQALTHPVTVPGEPAAEVNFMWLMTLQPTRSVECLGTLRFPSQRTPEQAAASEALLQDVIYILQSFEVR